MFDMEHFDYEALAPGIRMTVRWLHSLGFYTTDSGDGSTNQATGMECSEAWKGVPMVAIEVPDERHLISSTNWLWTCLEQLFGKGGVPPVVGVEGSYSPQDGYCVILLTGLDDNLLQTAAID